VTVARYRAAPSIVCPALDILTRATHRVAPGHHAHHCQNHQNFEHLPVSVFLHFAISATRRDDLF